MCHEYRPSAPLNNVIQRAEGPVYPVGVFYLATFYNIMVKPGKNNLTVKVCVLNQPKTWIPILFSPFCTSRRQKPFNTRQLYDTMFYALCEDRMQRFPT